MLLIQTHLLARHLLAQHACMGPQRGASCATEHRKWFRLHIWNCCNKIRIVKSSLHCLHAKEAAWPTETLSITTSPSDGHGFRVLVQEKTLREGKCHVRRSTICSTFGEQYVPAVAGEAFSVTLTDVSDSSLWPVLLTRSGSKQCAVTELGAWLTQSKARIGDTLEVFTEASASRHLVSLLRQEPSTADGTAAGQDANLQHAAPQSGQRIVQARASEVAGAVSVLPAEQRSSARSNAPPPATTLPEPCPQGRPSHNAPAVSDPPDGGAQGGEAGQPQAQQRSVQRPCAERLGCQPPAGGSDIAGGSAGDRGGLSSRGVQGDTRDGGEEVAGSGGGQPGSVPGGSGGEAVRAVHRKRALEIGPRSASALWPGVAQGMPLKQQQQVKLYTRCGRAPMHPGQEQEQLRAHPVKLVRYKKFGFLLTGVMAAVRELGVGEKEEVGLRRLPCEGLLLERWRPEEQGPGQGQQQREINRHETLTSGEEADMELSGGEEGNEDEEEEQEHQRTKQPRRSQHVSDPPSVAPGYEEPCPEDSNATEDSAGDVPLLKRRRLQGPALGGSGTQMGLCSQQGQEGAQASARGQDRGAGAGGGSASAPASGPGVQPCRSVGRGPAGAPAPGADVQPCHEVRFYRSSLNPSVAAARALWPQLADDLQRSAHSSGGAQRHPSALAVLHTCTAAEPLSAAAAAAAAATAAGPATTSQAGGGQLVAKPHTVQLNYSTSGKRWYVTRAGGVLAALGLRGDSVLQLRRTPDGRVWAEHAAAPAVAPTLGRAAAPSPAAAAPDTGTAAAAAAGCSPASIPAAPVPIGQQAQSPASHNPDQPLVASAGRTVKTNTPCPSPAAASPPAAPPAPTEQVWDGVRYHAGTLYPPAAVARGVWPQLAASLQSFKIPEQRVRVTLYTAAGTRVPDAAAAAGPAGAQLASSTQGPEEQHTAVLQFTTLGRKFMFTQTGGLAAALRLRGDCMLRLRRAPDGRIWAERAPAPAALPAKQSSATPVMDTAAGHAPAACSPAASPAQFHGAPVARGETEAVGHMAIGGHQAATAEQQSKVYGASGGTGSADSSAAGARGGFGAGGIRQGQQQQRSPAAHLPAVSLTPAHLHGCLPPGLAPPPLQPGELGLCGLTFHPDLAPGVRRAMADWEAGLGDTPLHEVEPEGRQVQVLGASDAGAAAWGYAGGWSAALVRQYQLRPLVLTIELVRLLGLEEEEDWGRELPGEAPVRAGLEQRRDEQRGGWGLWAKEAMRKSHPIGVMGGYVMPGAAAKRFVDLGWRDCSEGVKAEVRERVGGDGGRARVSYGWKMLMASYTLPYPAEDAQGGSSGGSAVPPVLSMLGYSTPTALANDPRVNPRAWQHGHDVDADQEQLQPNCGVVFVCVRGLVLPVLVALRDIAPGEQLLRDYGAAWWREVAGVWEVAEDQGLGLEELLHGRGQGHGQGGGSGGAAAGPDTGKASQPHLPSDDTAQCTHPAPPHPGQAPTPQPCVRCPLPPRPPPPPPPLAQAFSCAPGAQAVVAAPVGQPAVSAQATAAVAAAAVARGVQGGRGRGAAGAGAGALVPTWARVVFTGRRQ